MKKAILLLLLLPMLASAQYFDVFDIDTSAYPIMKAKFYSIDANGKQILNHTPADFEITENGEPRDVISVSCPEQKDEPMSIVIAVDVSGSMSGKNIKNSKESIKTFIDMIPNNGSEVAIIAFNSGNYFISDFTTNKTLLKSKVDGLTAGGGTDFNAAFINPVAGSLLALEKAKFKNRNIILVTDGSASGNEAEIINNAKKQNAQIYSLIIGTIVPKLLSNISYSTGGRIYKKVITEIDFNQAFINIRNDILLDPCEISWGTKEVCEKVVEIIIKNKPNNLTSNNFIRISDNQRTYLELSPSFINFGQLSKDEIVDTTISITAHNYNRIIRDIIIDPNYGYFEVMNTLPIVIQKDESIKLSIRYNAIDTSKQYSKLTLITDYCNFNVSLLGGSKLGSISQRTLELTHPNGGEVFNAGSDTNITWKGISDKEEVTLKFSSNNGKKWSLISNSATNLSTDWAVPSIQSDSCLISIDQYTDKNSSNNESGKIEWQKWFGGSGSDQANSIKQTYDNGYIIAGYSSSTDGDVTNPKGAQDYWIIKLNVNGDIEWEKSYGGSSIDVANSIAQTFDGGYIIAGYSYSRDGDITNPKGNVHYWVLKLKVDGELEWEKSFGGSSEDYANSIAQTFDGGYIVAGVSPSKDGDVTNPKRYGDYWILKLKGDGELDWQKSYGGYQADIVNSIVQTLDGGYIVAGYSSSQDGDISNPKGNDDYWIVKLSLNGDIEWEKSYGGSAKDEANSIIQTYDGGYIVAGYSSSQDGDISNPKGNDDYWIVKLSSNGDIQWEKSYGGSAKDEANSIIQTFDGGYIVAGESSSANGDITSHKGSIDCWIIKLKEDGDIQWEKSYGGYNVDIINSMAQTFDGGYILAGYSSSIDGDITNSKGNVDYWIIKLVPPPQPLQSDTSDAVFSIIMPQPVIQNNDIDMGEMIVGSTKDSTVLSVICNVGDAPLHVLGVDITGGNAPNDFLIPRGAGDFFLNKGECQDFMIEFTPSALGNRTAVATIRTTIGDFTDTIRIRGVGINPLIEATVEVVDFGIFELGNGKDTTVVLIKNVGSTPITITDTRISGPDLEQFTLNTTPLTYTIAAGQEETFELNYTARYGGRTSSILEFHYNGIGSPLRSMLFAEGIGGEVFPQVPDAYVGETVELGIFLGKIKPEGLSEVATNFSATVSYNSTLLAPIDKSMTVTTEDNKSFIQIVGKLSGVSQIAAVPMKVGLGTAIKSGLVITEFQLYDAKGDSVDYEIEPGVGEFNVLGICEEGGTRLLNPNGNVTLLKVLPNRTSNQTTVEMTVIESGPTELTIFDQIGNKIATVYSGNPEIGTKEIPLDLSNYANGRYYIKLTTPTITKTEILEVVR